MNWIAGFVTCSAVRMSLSASSVLGLSNRFSAAPKALWRRSLSLVVFGRIGVPTLNAVLIAGSERGSSLTAGRRRCERSAKSA